MLPERQSSLVLGLSHLALNNAWVRAYPRVRVLNKFETIWQVDKEAYISLNIEVIPSATPIHTCLW